jgi:probable HAF family extracellular repeat protein
MTHSFWRAPAVVAGFAVVALLLATPAPVAAASQPRYAAVDLGTLGGLYSNAEGINSKSQVVGRSDVDTPNGIVHAFLWDNGVMRDLGTLGGYYSDAHGIDDHGAVVGESSLETWGAIHAFLWENGRMTDLHRAGDIASSALAINEHGVIVGWHRGPDGVERACVWIRGVMQDLGIPSTILSHATAINDRGDVAGQYQPDVNTSCPFRWSDGVFQAIDDCRQNGLGGFATGINHGGAIVGIPGFVYDHGVVTSIPVATPRAINKKGQVAGGAYTASGHFHAVLLDNGAVVDVDAAGDRDSEAFAINDHGDLAGFANPGGVNHAVLWTPAK